MEQTKQDMVNHPKHYTYLNELCGVEPINICRNFNFAIGNALKYLLRKPKADNEHERSTRIEDLKKAVFYIQDEIKRLERPL